MLFVFVLFLFAALGDCTILNKPASEEVCTTFVNFIPPVYTPYNNTIKLVINNTHTHFVDFTQHVRVCMNSPILKAVVTFTNQTLTKYFAVGKDGNATVVITTQQPGGATDAAVLAAWLYFPQHNTTTDTQILLLGQAGLPAVYSFQQSVEKPTTRRANYWAPYKLATLAGKVGEKLWAFDIFYNKNGGQYEWVPVPNTLIEKKDTSRFVIVFCYFTSDSSYDLFNLTLDTTGSKNPKDIPRLPTSTVTQITYESLGLGYPNTQSTPSTSVGSITSDMHPVSPTRLLAHNIVEYELEIGDQYLRFDSTTVQPTNNCNGYFDNPLAIPLLVPAGGHFTIFEAGFQAWLSPALVILDDTKAILSIVKDKLQLRFINNVRHAPFVYVRVQHMHNNHIVDVLGFTKVTNSSDYITTLNASSTYFISTYLPQRSATPPYLYTTYDMYFGGNTTIQTTTDLCPFTVMVHSKDSRTTNLLIYASGVSESPSSPSNRCTGLTFHDWSTHTVTQPTSLDTFPILQPSVLVRFYRVCVYSDSSQVMLYNTPKQLTGPPSAYDNNNNYYLIVPIDQVKAVQTTRPGCTCPSCNYIQSYFQYWQLIDNLTAGQTYTIFRSPYIENPQEPCAQGQVNSPTFMLTDGTTVVKKDTAALRVAIAVGPSGTPQGSYPSSMSIEVMLDKKPVHSIPAPVSYLNVTGYLDIPLTLKSQNITITYKIQTSSFTAGPWLLESGQHYTMWWVINPTNAPDFRLATDSSPSTTKYAPYVKPTNEWGNKRPVFLKYRGRGAAGTGSKTFPSAPYGAIPPALSNQPSLKNVTGEKPFPCQYISMTISSSNYTPAMLEPNNFLLQGEFTDGITSTTTTQLLQPYVTLTDWWIAQDNVLIDPDLDWDYSEKWESMAAIRCLRSNPNFTVDTTNLTSCVFTSLLTLTLSLSNLYRPEVTYFPSGNHTVHYRTKAGGAVSKVFTLKKSTLYTLSVVDTGGFDVQIMLNEDINLLTKKRDTPTPPLSGTTATTRTGAATAPTSYTPPIRFCFWDTTYHSMDYTLTVNNYNIPHNNISRCTPYLVNIPDNQIVSGINVEVMKGNTQNPNPNFSGSFSRNLLYPTVTFTPTKEVVELTYTVMISTGGNRTNGSAASIGLWLLPDTTTKLWETATTRLFRQYSAGMMSNPSTPTLPSDYADVPCTANIYNPDQAGYFTVYTTGTTMDTIIDPTVRYINSEMHMTWATYPTTTLRVVQLGGPSIMNVSVDYSLSYSPQWAGSDSVGQWKQWEPFPIVGTGNHLIGVNREHTGWVQHNTRWTKMGAEVAASGMLLTSGNGGTVDGGSHMSMDEYMAFYMQLPGHPQKGHSGIGLLLHPTTSPTVQATIQLHSPNHTITPNGTVLKASNSSTISESSQFNTYTNLQLPQCNVSATMTVKYPKTGAVTQLVYNLPCDWNFVLFVHDTNLTLFSFDVNHNKPFPPQSATVIPPAVPPQAIPTMPPPSMAPAPAFTPTPSGQPPSHVVPPAPSPQPTPQPSPPPSPVPTSGPGEKPAHHGMHWWVPVIIGLGVVLLLSVVANVFLCVKRPSGSDNQPLMAI